MKATVYYIDITEEQRKELNIQGWDSAIGRRYMAARNGDIDFENMDLVTKAATLDAQDGEEIWTLLQNGTRPWFLNQGIECHTTFPRSMGVGDLICWEDGRVERCRHIGFEDYAFAYELAA